MFIKETNNKYASVLKLIHRRVLEEQTDEEKIGNYDGYGVKYKLTKRAWKK